MPKTRAKGDNPSVHDSTVMTTSSAVPHTATAETQDTEDTVAAATQEVSSEQPLGSSSTGSDLSEMNENPDIEQIQEELRQARIKQKYLVLREKLRKTRQINQELERRINPNDNPPVVEPNDNPPVVEPNDNPPVVEPRGQKRPRADTGTTDRPPPRPKMEESYRGRSVAEYETFMARMTWHHRQHALYFINDMRKVASAAAEMDDKNMLRWSEHAKDIPDNAITWNDYQNFLLRLIEDPQNMQRHILQKYNNAQQYETQSVHNFKAYLHQ